MMQLKKLVCLMLALALLPLSAALAEEESYFTARDLAQDYDANKAAMIQLLDSEIAAGTESVTVISHTTGVFSHCVMRHRALMRFYQSFPTAIPLYEAGYPRVTHPSATKSAGASSSFNRSTCMC